MRSTRLAIALLVAALTGVFAAGAAVAARVPGPEAVVWRGPALSRAPLHEPSASLVYAPASGRQLSRLRSLLGTGTGTGTGQAVRVSQDGGFLVLGPAPLPSLLRALAEVGLPVRTRPLGPRVRVEPASIPADLPWPQFGVVSGAGSQVSLVLPMYTVRTGRMLTLPSPAAALAASRATGGQDPPEATAFQLQLHAAAATFPVPLRRGAAEPLRYSYFYGDPQTGSGATVAVR